MTALPPGQSAILSGGYSSWHAPLAALFAGISAAGQPGGWSNFGAGVASGMQNAQAAQLRAEQQQMTREQFQMQRERFEAEQRRANKEEADRQALIGSVTNLLNPKPVAATLGGNMRTASAPAISAILNTEGVPPHARRSAIMSMGVPDGVLKRGLEPDGSIDYTKVGEGGIGAGFGPSTASTPNDGSMNILGRDYTAAQVAALRQMAANDPEGVMQMLQQNAFAEPDFERPIEIAGRLVDPRTGQVIADYSSEEAQLRLASRPQTVLNMPGTPSPDEMGRGEFAKANAAAQAKYFDSVATAGAQAQTRLGDINQLINLIELTPQGAGQEWINKGAAIASRFGIDPGEYANVPAAQAFQSIVSRIAPTLRVSGSGATSDFEMQQFLASLPAIANMPQGNRIIANNLKRITERSVQEAYIAAKVQGGDLSPAEGRKAILDLGPLNLDLPIFSQTPPAGGPGGAPDLGGGSGGVRYVDQLPEGFQ